ncbi:MAG: zinc-dependent alcohol dehydrogenase family protein [Anaerolineae bacterium]|nr:zinc-dependent alcohol dehydrogenase family protein [Anaerolineae bacterium]
MKAAQIQAPDEARIVEAPEPTPGPGEVLIEVAAAGICGTDLHIYHGEYEATYPIIPGHEFSGTVAAVGADVERYRPGDRVTADPNIPCNRCPACQRGEPNQCESLAAIGVTRDGAFAQYVVAPEGSVFPIGDMSFAAAALVEPLACVMWGIKRVQIQPGDSALIFGAGPMGCLLLQAVRCAGAAHVVVTDVAPWRLARAAELGATTTVLAGDGQAKQIKALAPAGYDVVVDATGIPEVLEQTFDFARPRGKIWVFGVCPRDARATFVPYDVFRKDLSIIGSFAVSRTFHESIALIQGGAVRVEPLISHRLPLDRFVEALELAERDPKRMKVQIDVAAS